MIEAIVDPIRNRAIGEDRGEAPPARFEQTVGAADVEKAFVLAGKARSRQILRRGRTAHRDRDVAAVLPFKLHDKPHRSRREVLTQPSLHRRCARAFAARSLK